MLEDGPCGLNGSRQNREGDQDGLEEGGDVSLYGVDWEDMEDELLMTHHYQHNPILLSNCQGCSLRLTGTRGLVGEGGVEGVMDAS